MTVPLMATPRPTHSAVAVPVSMLPPTVLARWAKIGAIMNAATARISSTIANTRWRLVAGREKPATNSAGATVAPRPMPVSPEPTSVSAWLEGTLIRKTAIPAVRNAIPAKGRYWIARLLRILPRMIAVITAPASSGK